MEGERKKEDKTARAGLVTESPPASVRGTKNGSDSRMILRRLRSTDLSHPATAIIFSAVTYENIRRDSTYIVCPSSACGVLDQRSVRAGGLLLALRSLSASQWCCFGRVGVADPTGSESALTRLLTASVRALCWVVVSGERCGADGLGDWSGELTHSVRLASCRLGRRQTDGRWRRTRT